MFNDLIQFFNDNWFWLLTIFCLLPLLLVAIIAWWTLRRINQFIAPSVERIERRYAEMRQRHPDMPEDALLRRIIHQESLRSGVIGAVTGVGGFFTLPIMLPIDIVASLRIQGAVVQFIATRKGHAEVSAQEERIRTYLIMGGGTQVTRTATRISTRAATNIAVRIAGKSLAKVIPFFGALIGFGVNYLIAQASSNMALVWYSNHPAESDG